MKNPNIIRLSAICLALAGLWVAASQQQQPQPLETVKVAGNLYIITGSGGNVGVYITGDGVILIDDKFDRNVPEIVAKVKALTDEPIKYILNTHHHGDHTGGNAALMKTVEVIAHANAREIMVEKNQPGLPRITFADQTAVHLGGKEVHAYYFGRGHTRGDAIIYFPEHKIVHTGDLFIESAPFIDYSSGGSGTEWPATLREVAKLDFETVIPGHGPVMRRADFDKWRKSMDSVLAEVTKRKKAGQSKEEIASTLKLEDHGWAAGPFFMQRSLPGLFDEIK
jgi:cyclase